MDRRVQLWEVVSGHSGKVLAPRFLLDNACIVSGSYGRTQTVGPAQQSLNEDCLLNPVVMTVCTEQCVRSGHFDKVQFWNISSVSWSPSGAYVVTRDSFIQDCIYIFMYSCYITCNIVSNCVGIHSGMHTSILSVVSFFTAFSISNVQYLHLSVIKP